MQLFFNLLNLKYKYKEENFCWFMLRKNISNAEWTGLETKTSLRIIILSLMATLARDMIGTFVSFLPRITFSTIQSQNRTRRVKNICETETIRTMQSSYYIHFLLIHVQCVRNLKRPSMDTCLLKASSPMSVGNRAPISTSPSDGGWIFASLTKES